MSNLYFPEKIGLSAMDVFKHIPTPCLIWDFRMNVVASNIAASELFCISKVPILCDDFFLALVEAQPSGITTKTLFADNFQKTLDEGGSNFHVFSYDLEQKHLHRYGLTMRKLPNDGEVFVICTAVALSMPGKEAESKLFMPGIQDLTEEIPSLLGELFQRDASHSKAILKNIIDKQSALTHDDLRLFIINTHAMKGALSNIGVEHLANFAGELEQAARKGEFDVMFERTPAFLNELAKITANDPQKEKEAKPYSQTALYDTLVIVHDSCGEYDMDGEATASLRKLSEMELSDEMRSIVNKINVYVLRGDFELAAAMAKSTAETL